MKTLQTRDRKAITIVVGFVLAVVFVVASFLSLERGSSSMAAAAVLEGEMNAQRPAPTMINPATARDSLIGSKKSASQSPIRPDVDETSTKTLGSGEASYYGPGFAGRPTANGERFDPAEMTAAHRTLPFGSRIKVTNTKNGKSVIVRVNDRGPYAHNRVIDLSKGAAQQIGMLQSGTADVKLELIS